MNVTTHTLAELLTRYERIFKAYNEARKHLGHEHPTTLKLAADCLTAKTRLDDHKKTMNLDKPQQLALI